VFAITVDGEAIGNVEIGLATCNHEEHTPTYDGAQELKEDIAEKFFARKPASSPEPDGNRGVQMATGNVANRVSHCHHGQAESDRDTE